MKHNYTFNFLIKYLYGEHSILRRLEVENMIETDSVVRKEFFGLRRAFRKLPRIRFNPSERTIARILEYSKNPSLNTSC